MSNAKTEVELLLNEAMPFAEQMLITHGEFYPFANAMKPSGEIVLVGVYDGKEQPPSQAMIDLLRDGLRADARAGKVKATALVYDVLIPDPRTGQTTDAIVVVLDHRDNYSVEVMFPYSLTEGKLDIKPPFAQAGLHPVFLKPAV